MRACRSALRGKLGHAAYALCVRPIEGKTDLGGERVLGIAALYVASGLTALWGIAHLFATRGVVAGFGEISLANRRVITMEWIVEGVALISIAAFVATANAVGAGSAVAAAVNLVAIAALIVLGVVSFFTGFRVAFLPYRLCPFIFGLSAALIALGTWG